MYPGLHKNPRMTQNEDKKHRETFVSVTDSYANAFEFSIEEGKSEATPKATFLNGAFLILLMQKWKMRKFSVYS